MEPLIDYSTILPEEALIHVFSFLPKPTLHLVRQVNKRWNNLSKDRILFGRKLHINIAVIGPTKVGKSTLLGNLGLQTKAILQRDFEKTFQLTQEQKIEHMRYAWLMDTGKDDRKYQGTVQLSRLRIQCKFHNIVFIDTPGAKKYIKNTICGITQADYALFLLPSRLQRFIESEDQILDQIKICKVTGIKQILVVITKMDENTVEYSQRDFETVKQAMQYRLHSVGFKQRDMLFIASSGIMGDNLMEISEKMPWYKGPTLLQAMEELEVPERHLNRPLRMCVDHACTVPGIGTVVVGTVIQGVVFPEQSVKVGPTDLISNVKSIHLALPKQPIEMGFPGDVVALALRNVPLKDVGSRRMGTVIGAWSEEEQVAAASVQVKNGKVVYTPEEKLRATLRKKKAAPLHSVTEFTAKVYMWNPMGKVRPGYAPNIHVHNAMLPVRFGQILKVFKADGKEEDLPGSGLLPGRETPQTKESEIKEIEKGQTVLIKMKPERAKLAIDTVKKCPKLGRFVIREGYDIIGAGLIMDVEFDVK